MPRDPKKLWHRRQGRLRRGAAAAVPSTKRQTQIQKKIEAKEKRRSISDQDLVYQAGNLRTFERQPGRHVEFEMDAEIKIEHRQVQVSEEGPEAESEELPPMQVELATWVWAPVNEDGFMSGTVSHEDLEAIP